MHMKHVRWLFCAIFPLFLLMNSTSVFSIENTAEIGGPTTVIEGSNFSLSLSPISQAFSAQTNLDQIVIEHKAPLNATFSVIATLDGTSTNYDYNLSEIGEHKFRVRYKGVLVFPPPLGSVELYSNYGNTLTIEVEKDEASLLTQTIDSPDQIINEQFGSSMSTANGVVIIGSLGTPVLPLVFQGAPPPLTKGAAYVYEKDSGGTWALKQTLRASDQATSKGGFGTSVDMSGDYAAISNSLGATYIFKRDVNGVWSEQQLIPEHPYKLASRVRSPRDGFKSRISNDWLVISNFLDSNDELGLGNALYLYRRNSEGVWVFSQKLVDPENLGKKFGNNMSLSGDYLFTQSDNGVLVFKKTPENEWQQTQRIVTPYTFIPTSQTVDQIKVLGNTAIIGRTEHIGASVHIYELNEQSQLWEETQELTAFDDSGNYTTDVGFGRILALSSNHIMVGSFLIHPDVPTYLFKKSLSGNWETSERLFIKRTPDPQVRVGRSIIIAGQDVIESVESPWTGDPLTYRLPKVYIFGGVATN